jgi:hypothetical protein
MTSIERAACSLCSLAGNSENEKFEGKPLWQSYLPQVRAVLDALHGASLRMTEAGAEIIRYVSPDESISGYQSDATNIWRFMIDAMHKDISTEA